MKKILVITPVAHIAGVLPGLERIGTCLVLPDPSLEEVTANLSGVHAIFTNPNKSRVFLSRELLSQASSLEAICTASTGTVHIDKVACQERNVRVLSLTTEYATISRITSTAEHAFALTMATLRNVVPSTADVLVNGRWDYERFIGRQLNALTVGVIGYGRLGKMYAHYCASFGARVLVHDPYQTIDDPRFESVALAELAAKSDVISLHVHVTDETRKMVDPAFLRLVKPDVAIINTARGEIVDETALMDFIERHPSARYSTDVLDNEIHLGVRSPLVDFARRNSRVLITPHIGGMTREAQEIAYNRAVELLATFWS